MTQEIARKAVTPIDSVRNTLELMMPQMAMALPKHMTPERMMRITMTAVQNAPKLLDCDRTSLLSAVMMCCQLGLEPDGVLGQAYLIPYGQKVQFIPGYKGLITLARNSGDVTSIAAHEVRENDSFDYAFGLNERLDHTPARGNRGEITHFYAIARFKDGGYHWDVMTREEVDVIRDNSSGYKRAVESAKKYNKPLSTPWADHYAEMGKKTVIRRIAKYLPMSVQKAVAIEAAHEAGKYAAMDTHGELMIEEPTKQETIELKPETTNKLDEFAAL